MNEQQRTDQPHKPAAALVVPGPPRNPVRLTDGKTVPITVVDFYTNPTPPRSLGGN